MKFPTHDNNYIKNFKVENAENLSFQDKSIDFILSTILNEDGRSDEPIVDGIKIGNYELIFHVGDYFEKIIQLKKPTFLNKVPVNFIISNPKEKYHVPLLFSPYSYSTYRGS